MTAEDRDYRRKQAQRSDAAAAQIRCPKCGAPPHVECNWPTLYCLERRVAGDEAGKPKP